MLITQTLTLSGGYTITNWVTAYPITQPTTLDAQGLGRVISATAALTVENLTVQHGIAAKLQNGGGAYFGDAATVTGTTFISNTAGYSGGAYFNNVATITSSTFLSNTAGNSGNGRGGGAWFHNTATITGTTFLSNTAGYIGGGAYFEGAATITNTTFTSNTAISQSSGGGAYFGGPATVTGTTFSGNTARFDGGGASFNSSANVTGTTFNGNMTNGVGGGAIFYGTTVVTNTTFTSNTAYYGGGVSVSGANAKQLVNVLFARNYAIGNGAAVYAYYAGQLSLVHATVVSDTVSTRSAMYVEGGTVYVTNTFVASYTVGIEQFFSGTVTENYNLFSNVATPYSGTVTSGGNSITGTAAFYDHSAYTLTAFSAAVDAGTNAGVSTDFFGNPRPTGNGYDMGYAEFMAIYKLFLPFIRK